IPIYYDDDDDEESSTPLRDIIISELPSCIAITHVLSTEEPKDSLIMGDKHLDTIPKKELDEFIKSSVEDLVPNPTECDPEEEIRLIEKLLYDNSSLRPSKEPNSENSDAIIEPFSPSPIPDSDYFMEEIDLSFNPDDPIPPSIEDDDDSEWDILFLERLLHDDPIPLPDTLDPGLSHRCGTFNTHRSQLNESPMEMRWWVEAGKRGVSFDGKKGNSAKCTVTLKREGRFSPQECYVLLHWWSLAGTSLIL
nr:hypothetical protein [Tanacetum cinerariifolium]